MKWKLNREKAAVILAVLVVLFALWGPEAVAGYKDKGLLNQIRAEQVESGSEGYRYTMNSNEKIYLLSKCLDNRSVPESEFSALTRVENDETIEYEGLKGTYAFVLNHQGPSDKEVTEEQIYDVCNRELERLHELGIIPESVREVSADSYTAVLYSAIDVLEPRNNVAVWKVSLSTNVQNADKKNRLIDAYVDAGTGKIYEFYVRTEGTWADMQPDSIMASFSEYLGLYGLKRSERLDTLTETTSNIEKYTVPGMVNGSGNAIEEADGMTTLTLGFYEGINELFLKVEK